jgi:hypothetical protein
LGKPSLTVSRCARCGQDLGLSASVPLDAACPGCGCALHACVQCRHFDPSARFECREELAGPVRSKSGANECTLFVPRAAQEIDSGPVRSDEAKTAFDDLFDF